MKKFYSLILSVALFVLNNNAYSQCSTVIFSETFDSGLGQFTPNAGSMGNWIHTTTCTYSNAPGHTAPGSALFSGSACEFGNAGSTVSGNMDSQPIVIPATGNPELSFNALLNTECGGTPCFYDVLSVHISANGGLTFTQLVSSDVSLANSGFDWTNYTFSLSAYLGQTIIIRFTFNSLDGIANNYDGIYIDDVTITDNVVAILNLASSYCENDNSLVLNACPVNPNYYFQGSGIEADSLTFNPALAGPGTHTIEYGYMNTNNYIVTENLPNNYYTGPLTSVALGDDQLTGNLPIGFTFNFYGNNYTDFIISSNGFITFPGAFDNGCCSGQVLPDVNDPNNLIAFAWNDLNPGAGGSIGYATTGTAPNQVLIVHFSNVPHFGGGFPVDVQVMLYEGTNIIEVHSVSNVSDGSQHTLGLENATGNMAAITSNGNGNPSFDYSGQMVRFDPTPQFVAIATANTTVHPLPLVDAGNDYSVCQGDPTVLNGSGATSYVWNNGVTDGIPFTPTATATYTVIGTDANGCSNTDSVTITLNSLPNVNVPDTAVCSNGTITLDAGTGFTAYSWNTGAGTQTINVNTSGTYWVTVVDFNGCQVTDTSIVSLYPDPTIFIGNDTTICTIDNLILNAPGGFASYIWSTGANTQSITVAGSQGAGLYTYSVGATDANGCIARDTIRVTIQDCTGINEMALNAHIILYPNPNSGDFTIFAEGIENNARLTIYSIDGKIILSEAINNAAQKNITLNVESGVYFIQISSANKISTHKLIIQK